jgi:hypothetical protein
VRQFTEKMKDKHLLTEEVAYFTRKFGRNPEG